MHPSLKALTPLFQWAGKISFLISPGKQPAIIQEYQGRGKTARGIPLLGLCTVESKMEQGEINTCAVETT